MGTDSHDKTIADLRQSTNGTIEELLPGFIKRHREEIMELVGREARELFAGDNYGDYIWGASAVLDVLSGGFSTKEPETR